MISEVAHRAGYDLSEWQSIAKLLSDARKKLPVDKYRAFYEAVTTYSRSRGSDMAALQIVEAALSQWGEETSVISEPNIGEVGAGTAIDTDADSVLAMAMHETASKSEQEQTPQEIPAQHEEEKQKNDAHKDDTHEEVPQKIMTIEEAKARILVIKNEIHELIGNPVALIGDMGSLGKTYMSALLTATRATMGGAGGGVMPAMRALEDVYEKLRTSAMTGDAPEQPESSPAPMLAVVQEQEATEAKEEKKPEHAPEEVIGGVEDEEPEPVREREPVAIPHAIPTPALLIDEKEAEVAVESEEQPEPIPEPQPEEEEGAPVEAEVYKQEVFEQVSPEEEVLQSVPQEDERTELLRKEDERETITHHVDDEIEALRKQLALLETRFQEREAVPEPVHVTTALEPATTLMTVAEQLSTHREKMAIAPVVSVPTEKETVSVTRRPLQSLRPVIDVRTAAFSDRAEKEKAYQSDAVTDGLRSLLMSWEIFRGGFLSGKERGLEHPLYKTMQSVVMSDILAGKFQGAKTNTVISVNDYVNAWRFEQGIEFNAAETFEHYLRRIIHRILTRAGELV